jgi:hypothetical protein
VNSFLKNTLFIGILFISNSINAKKSTQVYGQVVDQQTGSPVPFATIALISSSMSNEFLADPTLTNNFEFTKKYSNYMQLVLTKGKNGELGLDCELKIQN